MTDNNTTQKKHTSIDLMCDAYYALEEQGMIKFCDFCIKHDIPEEDQERIVTKYETAYGLKKPIKIEFKTKPTNVR